MKKFSIATAFCVCLWTTSCDDFFNVSPDDKLLGDDYPTTTSELYSGFMGLTACVQAVADQAIFMEGLRSNLFEPTQNSTDEIIDVYNYNDLSHNEFVSPVGYYNVILNVNDYISHVDKYYVNNPSTVDSQVFDGLIGGALRYKAWAYLMLAKFYGEAVWVDDPLVGYQDLSDYPLVGFDELIDRCIALLESGIVMGKDSRYERTVDGKTSISWENVLTGISTGDAWQWNRACPPAEALLAELYLENAVPLGDAASYQKAIDYAFAMLWLGDHESKPAYELTHTDWNGEWISLFDKPASKESIFLLVYDYSLQQTNRLVEYLYNGTLSKYLMRPSQNIQDLFDSQFTSGGAAGDNNRGGSNKTCRTINGGVIFSKLVRDRASAANEYKSDMPIILYRAPDIHFIIVEALIQQGRYEAAAILFESGLMGYWNAAASRFNEPITDFPACMYRGGSNEQYNLGIRGRVSMGKVIDPVLKNSALTAEQKHFKLDSLVVVETCLESAGEARSLPAMIRAAKRWNNPSFVADFVAAKYPEGQREAIRAKLQDPANWYIKYDLKQ